MSSNTTQMAEALASAGVPLPTKYERIWRYFKDHPRSTSLSCAQVLKLDRVNVSSYVSEMETRKMLSSEILDLRVKGAYNTIHSRRVKHYSTNIKEFEMLPKPRKPARAKKSPKVEMPSAHALPTPAVEKRPEPTTELSVEKFINSLTLRQAREVYDRLREVFA